MKIKPTNVRIPKGKRFLLIAMRAMLFFMCTTAFCLTTKESFSQENVVIEKNELVTVNKVFKIIKQQTNFNFAYPKSLFENAPKIQLIKGEIKASLLIEKALLNKNIVFEITKNNTIILKKKPEIFQNKVKSQDLVISGVVKDNDGQPLPGANILEKGTANGVQSDFDGKFSIEVSNEDAILQISYIGFKNVEVTVKGKNDISVTLEESSAALGEVVIVGFKGAEQRAIAVKRNAASVVEAISPQDMGNFSDENLGDALRRVPGVQIQEDQSGGQDGGSRVSVRGIGPAFVQFTVNNRQLLSGGVEGISRYRQFNVDVLPPEIIQGATIYKSSEANLIEPGLAGLVNFQTLKPLSASYKGDNNFFGMVNVRGEIDSQHDNFSTPTPRISALFGAKTDDDTFGAYISFLRSSSERSRDQIFSNITNRNLKEDTNGNGVWDGSAGGDTEFLDVLTPSIVTHNPIRENQERTAFSTALEWKPNDFFSMVADFQYSKLDNYTTRSLIRPGAGDNANGVISSLKVFTPGNLNIVDGFLQSYDTSGAFDSATGLASEGAEMLFQNVWFDNLNTTWSSGINMAWEKNGWRIEGDFSLSEVEYNQILEAGARSSLGANIFIDAPFQFDGSEYPKFTLGQAGQSAWLGSLLSNDVGAPVNQWNRFVRGNTMGSRLDLSKELGDAFKLNFGIRANRNDLFVAAVQRNGANLSTYLADQNNGTIPTLSGDDAFGGSIANFVPGNNFGLMDYWPTLNFDAYENSYSQFFDYTPGSNPLFARNVDIFDAPDIESEAIANGTDNGFRIQNGPLFQVEELTFATYAQLDFKVDLGKVPLTGNVGMRAVSTEYTGKAFTTITLSDPGAEVGGDINLGRVKAEVNDSRWDVLPALNLSFGLNSNLNYRFSVVKTMSRPEFNELAPGGVLSAVNSSNSTFDGNSGAVTLPNTELKPFTSWQLDNTLEWYNNFGGAVFVSAFYKNISDYIGSSVTSQVSFEDVLADGGFDTSALEDAGVLSDFQNQTYTVTQPQNIGTAKVFGFELGINQPLDIIGDAFKNFGVQANYNYVDAGFDDDEINSDDQFPGTSKHNFNTVAYFENDKFGLRAAYNIRSNFLRTLSGQGLTALPEYTEGRGQLDLRGNYNITKDMQFSVAIQNVTGADQSSFFRNNPSEAFQLISLEPIYTVGLRYGF
ncbi:TonB-dependent receptor [Cellulophaga sp. L1A9]|uniref:TonB-dependent receptor n=1 Tax=Cellulophaga sp. L1A9 TaxID=2686362 RepID=UPI00131A9521|nr:TonB-dependent receptor [Cellulophaga sp. L1A9]